MKSGRQGARNTEFSGGEILLALWASWRFRIMRPGRRLVLAALLAAAPVVALAGTFSWFDAHPGGFDAGAWSAKYAAFAIDLYRSDETVADVSGDPAHDAEPRAAADTMHVFGGLEFDPARAADPWRPFETRAEAFSPRRPRALGIAWQHRLDAVNQLVFSAGVGSGPPLLATAPELTDTRATVAFTSRWRSEYQPRVTGSVFVGGESATPEVYRSLGRRYYGFALGGELTLYRAHTPYVSFQMQRSFSAGEDLLTTSAMDDDRSQIAAGWKWQAQRHLSLQAEASYGYNGNRLRWQGPERSRVFFGTRYDFR